MHTFSALVLAMFGYLVCADCPITHYPRRLTIGFVHAHIDEDPSIHGTVLQYTQPLVEPLLQGSVQVAVGINSLDAYTGELLHFEVLLLRHTSESVTLGVMVLDISYSWVSLNLNYLLSESRYFQMGIVPLQQLLLTPIPYTYHVVQKLPTKLPQKAIIQVFLAGMRARQKQADEKRYDVVGMIAKLEELKQHAWSHELINKFQKILRDQTFPRLQIQEVQGKGFTFSFNVRTTDRLILNKLVFSYLIFMELEQKFNYVYGDFITTNNGIHKFQQMQHGQMQFVGITGLKYGKNSKIRLELSVGQDYLAQKGFYHSLTQNQQAEFFMSYFGVEMMEGSQCSDCPGSSFVYEDFCVSECPFGYVLTRTQSSYLCEKCDLTKLLIAKDGKCTCADGYYLVAPAQQCQPCPYDCLTCNGQSCLTCDTDKLETKRRLVQSGRCQCPPNLFYDDAVRQQRVCQPCDRSCQSCYGPQQTECKQCKADRIRSGQLCICKNNFVENVYGVCQCVHPNFIQPNGICNTSLSSCGENEEKIHYGSFERCECKNGTFKVKDKCIACGTYQQFDYGLEECVCDAGTVKTEQGCQPCKINQIYNPLSKTCDCSIGWQKRLSGQCIRCPGQTYYEKSTDQCECIFNYYRLGDACLRCESAEQGPNCRTITNNDDEYYL